MVRAEDTSVLVQSSEASGLLVRLDILQFDYLGTRQGVGELNRVSLLNLVLDDLLDVLFNSKALVETFVEVITLESVLIAT